MNRIVKLSAVTLVTFAALITAALAASSPAVSTGAAKPADKSALLRGSVNPNGAKTTYQFQWGLSTTYTSTSKAKSAGSGTRPVAISLEVRGLEPGTTYHFRLIAHSRAGTTVGRDRAFKTKGNAPPVPITGAATNITTSTATVSGDVNPNGVKTTWYVQYGLTTTYGAQTVAQTVPAGTTSVPVSQALQGLQAQAIFHYRLVAVNRGITEYGNDATFMTHPIHPPVPRLHVRTRPHHSRHRPYVFTTSGRLIGSRSIPSTYACTGGVEIAFWRGRHRESFVLAPIQSDCTFAAQTTFARVPGRHHRGHDLHVVVKFPGNGYLAPKRSRAQRVVVG